MRTSSRKQLRNASKRAYRDQGKVTNADEAVPAHEPPSASNNQVRMQTDTNWIADLIKQRDSTLSAHTVK